MEKPDHNPRMPLTVRGMIYALILVALAIVTAYVVIRGINILDDDFQYAVTIGLIVLFLGLFFTENSIWIGFWNRAVWSIALASFVFLLLVANGLFFEHFFGV